MSDVVISVEGLSKRYLLGHRSGQRESYTVLRDVLARSTRNFVRKAADFARGRQIIQGDEIEEFWALKDVSFDVKRGEVIGIVGRNGAGKSTLLKILSRITEPTTGRVRLRGRVASLLEVGTGFHPELSGRENIYLNGAILGMAQREIRKKFDEIVGFAEVEKFLDTPVKHYSSGMYVRLAFAVAAHLDPEILVIDEVLAVGDARFQEKCLGQMKDVAADGRTVLFVSHNMGAVLQLTTRAVLLHEGVLNFVGTTSRAIEKYMEATQVKHANEFDVQNSKRVFHGTGDVRILSVRFDRSIPHFEFGEPLRYIVRIRSERTVDRLRISMTLFSKQGVAVGSCFSPEIDGLNEGTECELCVSFNGSVCLAPGSYYCGVSVGKGSHRSSNVDYDVVLDTLFFEVGPEKTMGGSVASWMEGWGSISFPDLQIKSSWN
jgi:lipopolysaccharide transport system ATP-binding protein